MYVFDEKEAFFLLHRCKPRYNLLCCHESWSEWMQWLAMNSAREMCACVTLQSKLPTMYLLECKDCVHRDNGCMNVKC